MTYKGIQDLFEVIKMFYTLIVIVVVTYMCIFFKTDESVHLSAFYYI